MLKRQYIQYICTFLIFRGKGCIVKTSIAVNALELDNADSDMHLGHRISNNDKDSIIFDAICNFWRFFNLFKADFGHGHSLIKCKLFKLYCSRVYGAPLRQLSIKHLHDLCTAL